MKLFFFVFALLLLQTMAMPVDDGDDEAAVREVAVKATKFKKALTEFHDVLVQHPQILDALSDATPQASEIKKTGGSQQKNKNVNKKFLGDIFNWVFGG